MDDIFNFEFLPPVMVFEDYPMSQIMKELYEMDVFPMAIVTDKSSEMFEAANKCKPKSKKIKINCIILPIRYKTEFLA